MFGEYEEENETPDFAHDSNLKGFCDFCFWASENGVLNATLENLTVTTTESPYDEDIYDEIAVENTTVEDNALCHAAKLIDNIFLDRIILLPAFVLVISIAFFLQRKYLFRNIFNGRPGLIYPLNLLEGQQHRFSFVAGFVLVSLPMFDMIIFSNAAQRRLPYYNYEIVGTMMPFIINGKYIASNFSAFFIFAACLMKALEFYPVFATLTSHNLFSFGIGSLYIWSLIITFALDDRFCFYGTYAIRTLQMLKLVPPVLCMLYLGIYFPYRFCKCLSEKMKREKGEVVKSSWQQPHNLAYVKELLHKHKTIVVPPTRMIDKIKYRFYWPMPSFKYSISILTAVLTGLCFTYMAALAELHSMYLLVEKYKKLLRAAVKAKKFSKRWEGPAKVVAIMLDTDVDSMYKLFITEAVFWMNNVFEPLVYISIAIAFSSVVISMLLTMKNYRHNLLAVYRNQNDELLKRSTMKPRGILISGVKYAGYQISYAAWGFLIQTIITLAIGLFIAFWLVLMTRYKLYEEILTWLFNKFWCMITVIVLLMVIQNVLAHFVFLRKGDDGQKVLALNNRRFFFNFHYFAVFTNIAVGLISCILRIFRSVFFGLWTVPRLDMSTLNREFERLDAGYMSYVGLLYLEHTQRNPTMLVFVNILLDSLTNKSNHVICRGNTKITKISTVQFKRVRNRFNVWLTLERNPGLRLYRKSSPELPDLIKSSKKNEKQFFEKNKNVVVPYRKLEDSKYQQTKL